MHITNLSNDNKLAIEQAARLLIEGFAVHSPTSWPDMDAALEEVREFLGEDRISRIAVAEDGSVLGWIAGSSHYEGNVWELHPLVVSVHHQGKGIGRALVQDFEERVKERGGLTIMLGTDDEDYRTSLSAINLFPDVFEHIARIRNPNRHPYEFYQKMGYVIIGVIPDANGLGKPDILMAKSLVR